MVDELHNICAGTGSKTGLTYVYHNESKALQVIVWLQSVKLAQRPQSVYPDS